MLRKFITRKRNIFVLTAVAALAVAGGAFAYLNASGSGGGSGDVSSSAAASAPTLAVTQPAFTKIGDVETATVTATNNGTSPQEVTIDTFAVGSSAASGCPAGSFSLGTVTSTPQEIAPNQSAVIATAPVTFNDLAQNQNSCVTTGAASYTASSK